MALAPEQRGLVAILLAEGRNIKDPRVRRVYEKAAIETGLVESGLRNLPGGDRDSQGWRQERASLYKDPRNVRASARRFRQEFQQHYTPGERSWEVAAQVQRPAAQFRGRYKDAAGRAASILEKVGGGVVERQSAGVPLEQVPSSSQVGTEGGVGLAGLLAGTLTQQPPVIQSVGLQEPELSSSKYLRMAGEVPVSGGGPSPAPKVDVAAGLADLVAAEPPASSQTTPLPTVPGATEPAGVPSVNRKPGRLGQVKITGPNPGRVQKPVRNFLRELSGVLGEPVVGSDGTGHSKYTTSGNVSEHWTGNASDLPAQGARLTRMGRAALIAAGMSPKAAAKVKGGLFNLEHNGRRVQIIFNTNEGGNHFDHLHVGVH